MIFKNSPSNSGPRSNTRKNKLAQNTCNKEKAVKRLLMVLLQNQATGIFSANIPNDVEKEKPKKVLVIFDIKIATPVNPLDNKLIGSIKI